MTTKELNPDVSSRGGVVPLVAVVLALVALSGAAILMRGLGPSDGTKINVTDSVLLRDGRAIIQTGRPDGLLRAGDEVLSVAGQDLDSWLAHGVGGMRVAVGDAIPYTVLRDGHRVTVTVVLERFDMLSGVLHAWPLALLCVLLMGVATFIYASRPDSPSTRAGIGNAAIVLFTCVAGGFFDLETLDLVAGSQFWRWYLAEIDFAVLWAGMLHFALTFPAADHRPRPWRWTFLIYLGPLVLFAGTAAVRLQSAETPLQRLAVLGTPVWPAIVVYPALLLMLLIHKYATSAPGMPRRRLRWWSLALGAACVLWLLRWVMPDQLSSNGPLSWWPFVIAFLPAPIAVIIAVLRHRALGIDVAISRSLIYTILSVVLIGIYLTVVAVLAVVVTPLGDTVRQVAAAAVVVTLVQPLRARVQTTINQWLFGDRDNPYRLVSTLASRLEGLHTPNSLLPAVVEAVGSALRLPYVGIEVERDNGTEVTAGHGVAAGELTRLPLTHQGEQVGYLVVARRSPKERLRRQDHRALAEIARHAGAAVHSARLAADLQRSRSRLVAVREEERRRLLHDLHDGIGPTLAAVALGLPVARHVMDSDLGAARSLLDQLEGELQGAIGDIRRVARDLRPTALDRSGLRAAIEEHTRNLTSRLTDDTELHIQIDAPETLPALPAAVEVAAYRIICEALTNVTRHAQARHCEVRIWLDDDLHLAVTDDGKGLPAGTGNGVGLTSMRERAMELGGVCLMERMPAGGTRISASLPLVSHAPAS